VVRAGGATKKNQTRVPALLVIADALEQDLQPLAASGLITRLAKYDSNPANNPQPPQRSSERG